MLTTNPTVVQTLVFAILETYLIYCDTNLVANFITSGTKINLILFNCMHLHFQQTVE